MRQLSNNPIRIQVLAATLAGVLGGAGVHSDVNAQSMADYTNMPITISKTVEPNILFLVDMGNATLEAAYTGTGYYYPLSFKSPLTLQGNTPYYASNATLVSVGFGGCGKSCPSTIGTNAVSLAGSILPVALTATGASLTVTGTATALPQYTIDNLTDTFNPATKYYGIFDPERCYIYGANSFEIGADSSARKGKGNYSAPCPNTKWDGNFLNWLAMRKQEIIQKVLVGGSGHTTPAQANLDGTANSLGGEPDTGENGATTTCSTGGGGTTACWRYVKYVPEATMTGRVPDALLNVVTAITDGTTMMALSGMFFGVGGGKIFINDNASIDPFDAASGSQRNIKVDLTSEPDVPSGTGSFTSPSCDETTPIDTTIFAGHRVCYQREQSLGLFQTMQTSNMHVGVMMVNASTGKGGSLFFGFDQAYNANVVATLRNKKVAAQAPLAESLYEALCLFRKEQGPCYANSGDAASWGTNYTTATNTTSDPFYYVKYNKMVECCKNYVLMISPGIGIADGNNPDLQTPFPVGSTINPAYTANVGVKASTSAGDAASAAAGDRLDDVALYGHTQDLRSSLGGKQVITFYGVNALGRLQGATLLASAAKYGGFQDRNGDGTSNFTPTSGQTCNYLPGSNLNPGGTGPFYSDPEWDAHGPNESDPPDCIPDTFYDASDGYSLIASIQNAINDIMKKSSSGTSISVLASSSSGEGSIYQAYFYPETTEGSRKVNWTGYFQGLFVDGFGNLREDRGGPSGAPDARLVYTDDPIITTTVDQTTNDVMVQRFMDADGNGMPDSTTPYETVPLRLAQGLWEAGKKLALRDISTNPRNLFAWVDKNNDGVVDSDEQVPFTTANATTFSPYLRATTGTYTAENIISFLQGNQVSGMRDRELTVGGSLRVWRLGDIVNSSPIVVGPPRERFDLTYGDAGYRQFVQRWAKRRQTAYVGANDGMLHAFNVGYYHRGDDGSTTGEVEHGWYTTGPDDNSVGPQLGEELWGFVPHYVLPQLIWYTQPNYTHVSYVDLKPYVTDVRIFTPEAACGSSAAPTPTATGCIHPDGWGTVVIAGLRFGGSCGACLSGVNNGGPPLSVTADFNGTGTLSTRYFYSGYVMLDITDPEVTPKVMMAYSSPTLGLTTSYPTVVRMSPQADSMNDHTNAVWSMVVGSGVHGYSGRAAAVPSIVSVKLVQQGAAPTVRVMPVGNRWGYMGDSITYDRDLDFRADVVYAGQTLDGSCYEGAPNPCPPKPTTNGINANNDPLNPLPGSTWWTGKLLRLTMGTCSSAPCNTAGWGVFDSTSGSRVPTDIVTELPVSGGGMRLGPLSTRPAVTVDNSGNTWVFFGTGRYMEAADKTDRHPQYLVGVKDSVMTGCAQTTITSCRDEDLLDVTDAAICISCGSGTQVQGMGTVTTFTSLVDSIQGNSAAGIPAKRGWFVRLATNTATPDFGAERSVVDPTLIGGAIFFPTYTPSSDPCLASGTSQIFGLYYLTGTGHTDPIFGTDANGMAKKSVSVGQGMASSMAVAVGASSMTGICQSSTASFCLVKPKAPIRVWSQFMGWIAQKT